MKIKLILLGILLILITGCSKSIDKIDIRDTNCGDAKTYCSSLLTKDSEGNVRLDQSIMENSVYKDISCDNWSIKCNWYPID